MSEKDKKAPKKPASEKAKPKSTKIEVKLHGEEEPKKPEVPVEETPETEEAENVETIEVVDEKPEETEIEVTSEEDSNESEEGEESEADESEEVPEESAEDDDEDKKVAGPPGPYQPDMSKTIEEAEAEAEQRTVAAKQDPDIDEAVDDIVRSESDEVIEKADEDLEIANKEQSEKSFKQKLLGLPKAWWRSKKARYLTLVGLFITLVLLALVPTTRYTALNMFGVRVSSSMTVIDSQTRLPLKNINVSLQDKSALSDENGNVQFDELKLGASDLKISKLGYADTDKQITLGWGSNPIGEQEIVATGEQFSFILTDWKSLQPITEAEAVSGENSASADDEGKIVLTVGQENLASVEVQISSPGYRVETLDRDQLELGEDIIVRMVPAKKHAFVSNRSGDYDLYKIDVDGQNEELLLESSGQERDVPTVLQHPTREVVAFVSSRDGERNSDGFVLDGLFIVNVDSGNVDKITRSEQLQLVGWSGDSLLYWQVVEGTSRGNPERSKLISYNQRTGERIEISAANYFNDVELVDNTIYYAVSSFAVPQSQAKLYSKTVDGTQEETVIDSQVWNIFRTGYETLLFSAESQKWYEQTGLDLEEVPQQSVPSSRKFVDSPNGETTAWVEIRDGRGVLLTSSTGEFSEQQALSLPGLSEVLYWADDSTIVFRVISNSETADYVFNINGGDEEKISDVTATRNTLF